MLNRLYPYRFEIFFFSQIAIHFGSLVIPLAIFESIVSPVLFLFNFLAGILLISQKKRLIWFLGTLFIIITTVLAFSLVARWNERLFDFIRMGSFFLFYIVVTFEMIKQVWKPQAVNHKVIFGLISGYISLGLIGFFICMAIEMLYPGSYRGLGIAAAESTEALSEQMMYFSYITLLTIGYGDITPVSQLAQKSTILIGLMGQLYLVIVTAVVIEKYLRTSREQTTE